MAADDQVEAAHVRVPVLAAPVPAPAADGDWESNVSRRWKLESLETFESDLRTINEQ